jgi:hypothetical protein
MPPRHGGRRHNRAGADAHPWKNRPMKHTKLTLDLDLIQVVSYATQEAEERDEACPAASATLTARGPQ